MRLTKTTWLITIIVLLVALNIWSLFFRGPRGSHEGPKQYIIEQLHFSDDQQQQYQVIIDQHRNRIKELEHQMHQQKDALYALLSSAADKAAIDSAYASIAATHQQIESTHFNHFLDIRSICTPEQQPLYNTLSKEFGRLFQPGRRAHDK